MVEALKIVLSIGFGIWDILDFLIVWFIFYQFLRIFKGTKTPYMLLTVLLVLVIALFAQILNLSALNWILNSFKTVGLLALVIVFQPEIRRALATFGQSRIYRFITRPPSIPIDEIANAVYRMREEEIGALIVIQNRIPIEEYAEEGIEIDAKLSAHLLEAIFYGDNPLHDGAAIVREDRIIACAVKLPISSKVIDPLLGTRHQAAVGISEHTDAIAIVVSEERQTVRIAFKGNLSPPLEKEEFVRRIEDILNARE